MICRASLAALAGPLAALALATTLAAQHPPPSLPERLDTYLMKAAKLTSALRTQLLAGQPVTRMLDTDSPHEVAVLGAVWVAAPASRYLAAVRDIEQFENGRAFSSRKRSVVRPTQRISRHSGFRLTMSPT